ncbi:head-tail joining protein [Arenimonas oryziterrae]|uniref:Uncharacterized protein n=1 Tax=Arenimonas oryziterrae DSM 21050 = YC6267 TaxID=1121015 RepID=A0A091AQ95_9GAMM|nr:hypothetical protein [Arenimonas oryziterrae]KFN42338.1 hypothetical protein N789_14205 [Arenimonas oryziterrae DSM 21050 = YC6267]
MNQRDTLQALDADLHAAFADAGFAETALYTDRVNTAVPCRVYVDRDAQTFGNFGEVSGARTVVSLFLVDVADPRSKAQIVLGCETFVLDSKLGEDESLSRWVVTRG